MPLLGKKREPITVTLEITLDGEMQLQILQNSIERVINNGVRVSEAATYELKRSGAREDASILCQDLTELKPLTVLLWGTVAEALRRKYIAMGRG